MIFTRRFGALSARRTFPSITVIDAADYERQRKDEVRRHKAARASRVSGHRRWHPRALHWHGHS